MQHVNRIQRFGYSEITIEGNLRILFHNWDMVTAGIVISHEVDKQECMQFLENFKHDVETQMLGRQDTGGYEGLNATTDRDDGNDQ